MRASSTVNLILAASLACLSAEQGCWSGDVTPDRCCNREIYGPGGNTDCWTGRLSFALCCIEEQAPPLAPSKGSQADIGGALALSQRCWRGGFNFKFCCTRALPGGNPECWDGGDFTYEKCCEPPEPLPAALLFEDFNCERDDPAWASLRERVGAAVDAADVGRLSDFIASHGTTAGILVRKLRRLIASLVGECSLGRVAGETTALLLCLVADSHCDVHWAATARAMRRDALSITQFTSSRWPVLHLLRHVAAIVQKDDLACAFGGPMGALWRPLHQEAKAANGLSDEAMKALHAMGQDGPPDFQAPCGAGFEWAATIKMSMCAKSEVRCAQSYSVFLDWRMRRAAASGPSLRQWLQQAGSWLLQDWQLHVLTPVMRHRFELGLSAAELRTLGIEPPTPPSTPLCARLPPLRGSAVPDFVYVAVPDSPSGRPQQACRARCGASTTPGGLSWDLSGAVAGSGGEPGMEGGPWCVCALLGALQGAFIGAEEGRRENCSGSDVVALQPMPALAQGASLLADFLRLGPDEAPVFSQATASLPGLRKGVPVFATMIFGHMAKYIERAFRNMGRLEIPNVVVYTLDDGAEEACERAGRTMERPYRPFCLRGEGRTALQKYIVVLAYVSLGLDVFWFDFDSIWLQNPVRALESAADHDRGVPGASLFAAIDFDSKNRVMNAFFLVRAGRATRVWLLSLLQWIYRRPFVHDQVAFAQMIGIGPLVDDEPVPKPPVWSPLDPNVFANAARFSGLGFSSEVDDLVLFHFFDGWNSNMPDEVEQWATPIYRGVNLFEVLYGDDVEAARSAIAKSRMPPPETLADCRYMSSLGLGMDVQEAGPVALPLL